MKRYPRWIHMKRYPKMDTKEKIKKSMDWLIVIGDLLFFALACVICY